MYVKIKLIVSMSRHGFENAEVQIPIAYNTANNTIVGNIFSDINTGKAYKGISVRYINSYIEGFKIRHIFECLYAQVPVTYFEDLKDTGIFDGPPGMIIEECRND